MNAICFKSKLGPRGSGGDWDLDSATVHEVRVGTGRTFCGVRIGIDIRHGGQWEKGSGNVSTNCHRCLHSKLS